MALQEKNKTSWDEYFMHLAEETSTRSKDQFTKVGCCIVKDKRVLSLGYNGPPRNFPDDTVPNGRDTNLPLREQKNSYMCHAELNAILNYLGNLSDLKNSSVYVTVSPCHECAKAMAQIGVKSIIYKTRYHREDFCEMSKIITDACNIDCNSLDDILKDLE